MKFLYSIAMVLMLSGCVSTMYRVGNEIEKPYQATRDVWSDCVCVWWKHPTMPGELMASAYIKLTYLFWVVDCPCEAVVDTVCLPYDLIAH